VILLTGGAKQRQPRDIQAAKELWADYRRRKRPGPKPANERPGEGHTDLN
jgi:hypothetical protein